LLKELKSNKKWVENFNKIQTELDDLEVLYDFQKEGEATEEQVDDAFREILELI